MVNSVHLNFPPFPIRARKIPVQEKSKKPRGGKGNKKDQTDTEKEEASATPARAKGKAEEKGKRKKRKIRLDMHLDQVFLDTQDAYVWLYDPIPWFYWVGGTAIVLGETRHSQHHLKIP